MRVPIYLEFENNRVVLLGGADIKGSHELDQAVNLGKLPTDSEADCCLNYNYDLLTAEISGNNSTGCRMTGAGRCS